MDAQQLELDVAKANARAAAYAEAAALAATYERQNANIGFLRRVLAGRADRAYDEADALRHHPARESVLGPVTA